MISPDITATTRAICQRALDGTLTEEDRRSLEISVATPIQHDPRACVVCQHEAATAVPPLITITYDPADGSLAALIDEGPAQGSRCGDILQRDFDHYPQAREYARAIAQALGTVRGAQARPALVALAGAIHHLIKKAEKGTL